MQTLGEKLEEIQIDIPKAQKGDYTIANRSVSRSEILEHLYAREDKLLSKISKHGRDYIEGANKSTRTPFRMLGVNVSF